MESSGPSFSATESVCIIKDLRGSTVVPEIHCELSKGILMNKDQVWTCYRRNYFYATCSYSLSPSAHCEDLHLVVPGSVDRDIRSMALTLRAHVHGSPERAVDITAHTPKRAAGPTMQVPVVVLPPRQENKESLHNSMFAYPPSEPSQCRGSTCEFERLQFRRTTANNGKRRAQQQYFALDFELRANHSTEIFETSQHIKLSHKTLISSPNWTKVAQKRSTRIVVLGKSPSHYQPTELQYQHHSSLPTCPGPLLEPAGSSNPNTWQLQNLFPVPGGEAPPRLENSYLHNPLGSPDYSAGPFPFKLPPRSLHTSEHAEQISPEQLADLIMCFQDVGLLLRTFFAIADADRMERNTHRLLKLLIADLDLEAVRPVDNAIVRDLRQNSRAVARCMRHRSLSGCETGGVVLHVELPKDHRIGGILRAPLDQSVPLELEHYSRGSGIAGAFLENSAAITELREAIVDFGVVNDNVQDGSRS